MNETGMQDATFQPIDKDPCGMDQPYFVESVYYEHPGYSSITVRELPRHRVTVGDQGLQVHDVDGECLASAPLPSTWSLPLDGWNMKAARCDQTGGMCMVDVLTFANDWVVSLTAETVCLHPNMAHYEDPETDDDLRDADEPLPYVDLTQFTARDAELTATLAAELADGDDDEPVAVFVSDAVADLGFAAASTAVGALNQAVATGSAVMESDALDEHGDQVLHPDARDAMTARLRRVRDNLNTLIRRVESPPIMINARKLIERFPGLLDGDTPVDGADLVDAVSALVRDARPQDSWGRGGDA